MKTFWHLKQSTSMMLMFIRVCLHTLFIVPILSMSSLSSFWPSTSRENSSTFPIPIGMLFEAYYGCKYFSWFGICLYTLILIFVLFSIHVCVCVFFFFFSWSNNLYLKGNKNLSWFGNFTSVKNYSHHFNKQIAGAERKKNVNTKQIQQQNFSTRLLHNYQQQVGDTPKGFSTHLRMDNSLTCGQNFKAKFHFYVPQ